MLVAVEPKYDGYPTIEVEECPDMSASVMLNPTPQEWTRNRFAKRSLITIIKLSAARKKAKDSLRRH